MNKNKKRIFYGLGSIIPITVPIMSVLSCDIAPNDSNNVKKTNISDLEYSKSFITEFNNDDIDVKKENSVITEKLFNLEKNYNIAYNDLKEANQSENFKGQPVINDKRVIDLMNRDGAFGVQILKIINNPTIPFDQVSEFLNKLGQFIEVLNNFDQSFDLFIGFVNKLGQFFDEFTISSEQFTEFLNIFDQVTEFLNKVDQFFGQLMGFFNKLDQFIDDFLVDFLDKLEQFIDGLM